MATYFISTTGNDTNTGTRDNPFASVAKANTVVQPGDTVYFKSGTYQNSTFGDGNIWKGGLDVVMRIEGINGTASNPITYAAEPGGTVKLQYDGNGAIRLQNSSYIHIEGFDIEGPNGSITLEEALDKQFIYRIDTNGDGSLVDEVDHVRDPAATLTQTVKAEGGERSTYFNSNAISVGSGSNHIEIVNNKIHDSPGHAIASLGGADYVKVTGNEIYNNTWYSSLGNHSISFKGVVSSDTADVRKIIVDGNYFYDNHNLLISWSSLKTSPVEMVIDEGKTIHVQNASAALGFDHGSIQISNNVIERSGNAGITVNVGERVIIANNTIVDAGDINRIIANGGADPKIEPGYTVAAGGFRIANGKDIHVINNLILVSNPSLNVVDATADLTPQTAVFAGNVYAGGTGLFLRYTGDATALTSGFTLVQDLGFQDRASGNYNLLVTSPAINAGSPLVQGFVVKDYAGTLRAAGTMDVGAFEADLTEPTIVASPPAPGAGLVGVSSELSFNFSEVVKAGSGTATLKNASGAVVQVIDLASSTGVTFDGQRLHLNPEQDLLSNANYSLTFSDGALKDAAGNLVAASSFTFATTPFARYVEGDATANIEKGSADNDFLRGNGGIDNLDGLNGSDVYVVNAGADHAAAEFHDTGTIGTDTIRYAATVAGGLRIYAGDTGIERVEIATGEGRIADFTATTSLNVSAALAPKGLAIVGNAGRNIVTGSKYNDSINGSAGNDYLLGSYGNDAIIGGTGKDLLKGGPGSDRFYFTTKPASSNIDTIYDFSHGSDRILLDDTIFRGLGKASIARKISVSEFKQGKAITKALDSSDNIIYNTSNGALYYDADGHGGAASVKIAQLGTTSAHPLSLSYLDFWVY